MSIDESEDRRDVLVVVVVGVVLVVLVLVLVPDGRFFFPSIASLVT